LTFFDFPIIVIQG